MANKITYGIVIAAAIAILLFALQFFGIAVPSIVIKIGWVVVVAVICITAIKFLIGYSKE